MDITANRDQWLVNLSRLNAELGEYAEANSLQEPGINGATAATLGRKLPLSHATSARGFSGICQTNTILSPARLAASFGRKVRPSSAEAKLGTADYVFFYAAPFGLPERTVGLLFAPDLEDLHRLGGNASPFDSGGLIDHCKPARSNRSPGQFLAEHTLPLPDYRGLLGRQLLLLFDDPWQYVSGGEPRHPGPIGLSGGDQRRWVHEVRIPQQVALRDTHLQAVFIPISVAATDAAIQRFLHWCEERHVDRIPYDTPRGEDFVVLRRKCIEYLQQRIQ